MTPTKPNHPNDTDRDTNDTLEEFIARHSASDAELRDTIAFLIQRRELLRDCEIEQLEAESEALIEKLADTKRCILLAELECFREVLSLHKRLLSENDEPQD